MQEGGAAGHNRNYSQDSKAMLVVAGGGGQIFDKPMSSLSQNDDDKKRRLSESLESGENGIDAMIEQEMSRIN